jgi:hypothetical protein
VRDDEITPKNLIQKVNVNEVCNVIFKFVELSIIFKETGVLGTPTGILKK